MHPETAHKHTNLLWIFLGLIFCALFLVFSLPKGMQPSFPTGAQVAEFTPSVVTVSSVSPSSVYQAATVQLDITGADFNSSAVVSIENVTVLSIVVVNDTLIQSNISVPANASTGVYDVNITQDSETGMLIGGLTILEGPFDISTLKNVTPASGYVLLNTTVNLTYNISTGFGVDKSSVNITSGYINITNLNTSNSTILNLTNVTDPSGTFTLQFAEHTFDEEGKYFGEIYLDVDVGGTEVDSELYSYIAVGSVCSSASFIGGTCCEPGSPGGGGVTFFGSCDGSSTICGQDLQCEPICSGTTPSPICPAGTSLCQRTYVFKQSNLCNEITIDSLSLQSISPQAECPDGCEFGFGGNDCSTIATYSCPDGTTLGASSGGTMQCCGPPPPPVSHGGGGGGSNPYPAENCCCLDGPLKGQVLYGSRCLNVPTNTKCFKSTQNINDPVCAPVPVPTVAPPPKPVVQAPVRPVQPPVTQVQTAPVQAHIAPPQTTSLAGKAVQTPVAKQSSSSVSLIFAALALIVIVAGLAYWQFFYKRR